MRSTHAANFLSGINHKNWQEVVPTQPTGNNIQWANTIIDNDNGGALKCRHLINKEEYQEVWTSSFSKELDQLAQGRSQLSPGTNTLFFRKYQDIPADRRKDVTYGRVVVDYRPQKEDPHRTRLTVGGDRIKYPGNVSTPTTALTTTKLVINSTISTPRACCMCCDLGNFYLGTPLDRYEYIRLSINIFPQKLLMHTTP